jgi:LmbE family N-acetylglucosaminyl deacetylase
VSPTVATVVFFHAHPDDESMATAGTMAALTAEGHRVVLVTATDGAKGEVPDGFLDPGEDLASRRRTELERSCEALGVARLELLGYGDSGMMGTPANDEPGCFWQADVDEAAERLAALLREEAPEAFTCYDENGGYGHPDHIQVHRVGVRAAELAGVPRRFLATIDRDRVRGLMAAAAEMGLEFGEEGPPDVDFDSFGVEGSRITTEVDVSAHLVAKRRSMEAHASQIRPDTFPLSLPHDAFDAAFGVESYVRLGAEGGASREPSLLDAS